MKKILISLLMLTMILSLYNPMVSHAADDLTGHKYEEQIRELIDLGIINGYKDGTIRPDEEVTRAEFAKMVVQSFELGAKIESAEFTSAATENLNFTDIKLDAWYAAPIMEAVKAGVVKGYPDNTFKPNDLINREQMASMVARALEAKGVVIDVTETPALEYSDSNSIRDEHNSDVRILSHLGIMKGNTDGSFKPKEKSKRWMVALVMLDARDEVFPPKSLEFQASSVSADKTTILKQFDAFADAKKYVQSNAEAEVVERSNQILWMESGIAVTNAYTEVYPETSLKYLNTGNAGQFRPYVTSNTEMKYLDSTDQYVKVELAGKVGYVKPSVIKLIPSAMQKGQSYYEVSGTDLIHKIFNHSKGSYASAGVIGKAPAALAANVKYYSWDGAVFTDSAGKKIAEAHQYFNKLPLGTTSNYTAAELDKYLENKFPYYGRTVAGKLWNNSPLAGREIFQRSRTGIPN